ncbi:MAG: hypothetical protein GF346_10870 [Candidatus Eisenbacteria bacterium]|nr:hypothetical protein [Candidatus Latescibacterota bacterium]MBD3302939.1 hypothetical protein [Candidatus Eisenbacteria bacterium]
MVRWRPFVNLSVLKSLAVLLAMTCICLAIPSQVWSATASADPPLAGGGERLSIEEPGSDDGIGFHAAQLLFDSGTPVVNPYGTCGSCYAWSSTYYSSPTNFDLTARAVEVPSGSMATSIRLWWAYGDEGPHPNSANKGGVPADFSSIAIDLYDATGPGGSPGTHLATLPGTWVVLNAAQHYKEYVLDTPYVFTGTDYFISLRAETAQTNYNATLLWLMCAPDDVLVDYENYDSSAGNTGGWADYPSLSPCPNDQDFGGQILGFPTPTVVEPTAESECITGDNPCNEVEFELSRSDDTDLRAFSVTFHLESGLELCVDVPPSITEGTLLNSIGGTSFQVIDNGGGSYTVDCAILGIPCGATTGGLMFSAEVAGVTDGSWQVVVDEVLLRDCDNAPIPSVVGSPETVVVDTQAPVAVSDLGAAQIKTGNGGDGTTGILLTYSEPGDAASYDVYRKAYGDYPEYDDGSGAVPSAPSDPGDAVANGWTQVAGVSGTGHVDEPATRDFYYYVLFSADDCGNVSAASNMTGGTLNYHLGDVSDGTTPGSGDNLVDAADVSLLGAHYGITLTHNDSFNYLDVGPTTDYSVDARPTTDNVVGFEDLILFAINYGEVALDGVRPELAGRPDAESGPGTAELVVGPVAGSVAKGQVLEIPVLLRGDAAQVQGIRAVLSYDGTLLAHEGSEAAGRLEGLPHFFKALPRAGEVDLNLALLGRETALADEGAVAIVRFRALRSGDPAVRLTESTIRDARNREMLLDPEGPRRLGDRAAAVEVALPSAFRLGEARPNPFNPRTLISFDLPEAVVVRLAIYDASGRLVRTLVDGAMPAGGHSVEWDGTDDAGRKVGTGVFFYEMRAGDHASQKRMTLLK